MPNLNDIIEWRRSRDRGLYSRQKRKWTGLICLLVSARPVGLYHQGAHFLFTLREPNKRRDPDGVASGASKFILDALQESKVILRDSWAGVLGLSYKWEVDKRAPGVLVRMSDAPL